MAKNPSRVVWMLKNGDMVVKKNLILVILDSRRIFMLGLPFDDSNFFKNFEYFFLQKFYFFKKSKFSRARWKIPISGIFRIGVYYRQSVYSTTYDHVGWWEYV